MTFAIDWLRDVPHYCSLSGAGRGLLIKRRGRSACLRFGFHVVLIDDLAHEIVKGQTRDSWGSFRSERP